MMMTAAAAAAEAPTFHRYLGGFPAHLLRAHLRPGWAARQFWSRRERGGPHEAPPPRALGRAPHAPGLPSGQAAVAGARGFSASAASPQVEGWRDGLRQRVAARALPWVARGPPRRWWRHAPAHPPAPPPRAACPSLRRSLPQAAIVRGVQQDPIPDGIHARGQLHRGGQEGREHRAACLQPPC